MLKATIQRTSTAVLLEVEGKLSGPWVEELRRCWRAEQEAAGQRRLSVKLEAVSYIDAAGKELLAEMCRQGTEVVGTGCMTRAIVAEITGRTDEASCSPARHSDDKKGHHLVLILALGLGFLLCRVARAEEKPVLRLTLREAVSLALKQNPQVQITVLSASQSQQDQNIARSFLLPQASLEVAVSAARRNLETGFGTRVPGFPQHAGPFEIFDVGPQFTTPIFDLTLWRRWQAAQHGVRASEAQRDSAREQVTLLVVSQYLGCLRAGAEVRAAQSRVELAQALYAQAADLQKSGVGTGIDTLRANVELQNERQRLILAETARQNALSGLVRLLSLDPRQDVELGDELSFFETPEFGAERSLESAYAQRPEMRQINALERAALDQRRAASEQRLPALRFTGTWFREGTSVGNSIPTYQYTAGLDLPLFTGGRIRAEIVRADLELKKIGSQRDDLRNQIALEVKTALANLDSARNEVTVARLGVQLAGEEVTQARDRFQAGVANNIEVISAQDALARANDNEIAALYRYNQARADLAHAIGQMESLYAK